MINFAVVGFGHIGKRHAEMISRTENAKLLAVIDIDREKNVNHDGEFFLSWEDFCSRKLKVDVINICLPNGLHFEYSMKALEMGYHVVIEKPMTLKRSEAESIVFRSLERQKHVFIVKQNRFSPPSVWLKNLVDSGKIGKIFQVDLSCYWNRDERYYTKDSWHGTSDLDGGTLFTQFSHFVDLMYWIFGDIDEIIGRVYDHNHTTLTEFEDSGHFIFHFLNGAKGSFSFSTSCTQTNLESTMIVIGEKATIKISGQYMDKLEVLNSDHLEMPDLTPTKPGNDYGAYKGSAQNHDEVILNVVKALVSGDVIATNALEGMKVIDIIERMYKSTH